MFWEVLGDLLTPFNHTWQYLLVYVAGFWLVTTGLVRFGPRQCSVIKSGLLKEEYYDRRKDTYVKAQFGERPFTNDECISAWHWNHVVLRQFALLFGLFWPVIFYGIVPVLVVLGFIRSIYMASHAKSIFPSAVE